MQKYIYVYKFKSNRNYMTLKIFFSYSQQLLQSTLIYKYFCDEKLELEEKQENACSLYQKILCHTHVYCMHAICKEVNVFFSDQDFSTTLIFLQCPSLRLALVQFPQLSTMCPMFQGHSRLELQKFTDTKLKILHNQFFSTQPQTSRVLATRLCLLCIPWEITSNIFQP